MRLHKPTYFIGFRHMQQFFVQTMLRRLAIVLLDLSPNLVSAASIGYHHTWGLKLMQRIPASCEKVIACEPAYHNVET
jgi:hypothetical protein